MTAVLMIKTFHTEAADKRYCIKNISRCRDGNCQCYITIDTLVLQEQQFGTHFAHSV